MLRKWNMVERCFTVLTEKCTKLPQRNRERMPGISTSRWCGKFQLLLNSRHNLTSAVVLVAFVLSIVVVCAGQDKSSQNDAFDEILIARRAVQKGMIVGMSRTDVTIAANRTKVTLPVNEIVNINFAHEPAGLKKVRRLIRVRQFELALETLDKVKLTTPGRALISQDVEYYQAGAIAQLALTGKGDKDAAIKLLRAFVSQYKENYHYFSAMELLSDLSVANAQYDAAAQFSCEVAKAPWPAYKLRSIVIEGRSLQARKKYAEAIEKYEQVIRASKDIPGADEPRRRAIIGKTISLAEMNDPAHAQGPIAELHVYETFFGDGASCCWEFYMWQEEGVPGNLMYVEAQVTPASVIMTPLYGPDPGPGSATTISSNTIRWDMPAPDGLWTSGQTVDVCFKNIPASGATVTFTAYANNGSTYPGLQQQTFVIGANGECSCLSDVWMKDTMAPDLPEDFGVEPTVSQHLWISRDIWIRNTPDQPSGGNPGHYANEHQHYNPVYVNATTENYIYVKVRNRGCAPNPGGEMLRVYWADASTGLPAWPDTNLWHEIDSVPGGTTNPYSLPGIAPGQDYVVQLPWVPPDPTGGMGHFCLVARIETYLPAFGMTVAEGPTLWQNVANNNNIVWKNVTVVTSGAGSRPNKVIVRNTLDQPASLNLRFAAPERESRNHFLLHGDIFVDVGEVVMQKWRRGGHRARGFEVVGNTTIRLTDLSNAELGGLRFEPGEQHTIEVRMQLRPDARVSAGTTFNWDIIQSATLRGNAKPILIGGERYIFSVPRTRGANEIR
jgi:tetratricopeptide (TPR) repeat protein